MPIIFSVALRCNLQHDRQHRLPVWPSWNGQFHSVDVAVACILYCCCSRTYCERVFSDCKLQTCYVQSPAYPGVYPRHLHCRYQLNTRLPFIKLYIENEEFNIDGHRCENIMTCPMRPISSGRYEQLPTIVLEWDTFSGRALFMRNTHFYSTADEDERGT